MKHENDQIRKIMISINQIDGVYYRWARKIGLPGNMLALLYALSDGKSYSQKQISEEWLIPKTTINTVIKECILKGYVVLQQEPHTKEKMVCLTDAGKEYTEDLMEHIRLIEREAFHHVQEQYPIDFPEIFEAFAHQLKLAYEANSMEINK